MLSRLVCLSLLSFIPILSIKFTAEIPGLERLCFYQVLGQSQKYNLELIPKNQPKYQLQIAENRQGAWVSVHYKMTQISYERTDIHKLSNIATTYSFCIKNIEHSVLTLGIKFQTGIDLMEFQVLPDKSDTQNLEREVLWIENQKKVLYDTIRQVQQRKADNVSSSNLLSTKMIIFAIIGLLSIVVVNFMFFKEVKKTFKQRKLI